jgi:hypothetical protein
MRYTRFILMLVTPFLILLQGCSGRQPVTLDQAMALYHQNKLEQALPLFQQLVAQEPKSYENHVWLAETFRRLGNKEEALKIARMALELNPRSSFANTVIAEVTNPVLGQWSQSDSDTSWVHALRAVECDSTDGHPWLLIWGEAIERGQPALMHKALRQLVESRFLTKAALAYGRWMLRGLPANAVLITNGDMDTYPPCAVQEVEGFRRDVTVVNRGTLNERWYARFIRDQANIPLPLDDARLAVLDGFRDSQGNIVTPADQIFRGWMGMKARGEFKRPLALAVTVEESFYTWVKQHMRSAGAFLVWSDTVKAKTPDTAAMAASLEGVAPDDFSGPWVSDRDRSPIRRLYTKNIVRNVTETALVYAESLIASKHSPAAERWIAWAEELDRTAELGPVFTERIAVAKARISEKRASQ